MVENDSVVDESIAEGEAVSLWQNEMVTVSVTGSHEDNALEYRVSKHAEGRRHGAIFGVTRRCYELTLGSRWLQEKSQRGSMPREKLPDAW